MGDDEGSSPSQGDFPSTDPTDTSIDQSTAFGSIKYLRTLTNAWWGSELTAQELIAIILFLEASVGVYQDANGNWQMNGDVIEMMTRKYNEYCGSGGWSSSCFTGFWRYFQPLLILNTSTLNNILNYDLNNMYDGIYISTAEIIMNNKAMGGETGYPDRPAHWATISPSQTIIFNRLNEMLGDGKLKYFHTTEGDSIFIVLSVNEATELCGSTNCMHK